MVLKGSGAAAAGCPGASSCACDGVGPTCLTSSGEFNITMGDRIEQCAMLRAGEEYAGHACSRDSDEPDRSLIA